MPAGQGWQLPRSGDPNPGGVVPGGQEPERRAAPGAAGSQVQSRIMTHLQAEGMEAHSKGPPRRSGNMHDQGQITQQHSGTTVQPPPCDLSQTLTQRSLCTNGTPISTPGL